MRGKVGKQNAYRESATRPQLFGHRGQKRSRETRAMHGCGKLDDDPKLNRRTPIGNRSRKALRWHFSRIRLQAAANPVQEAILSGKTASGKRQFARTRFEANSQIEQPRPWFRAKFFAAVVTLV
jgi:hypothetical protein